jgi:iron complex transport system permease protein
VTPGHRGRRTAVLWTAACLTLVAVVVASLAIGSRPIAPDVVWQALTAFDPSNPDHSVVVTQRVPRTVIGLAAGAALGLAGTMMQGLTRNPLADPGLLGVNAGASVAVLLAITALGAATPEAFVWFAFAGAAAAALLVGAVAGIAGAQPARLALTGAAVTVALTAIVLAVLTSSATTLAVYRYWTVGGLTARGLDAVALVAVPLVIGAVIALGVARGLDLLALGDDVAAGLGHSATRTLGVVASVLLCGGATAIAGPIVFLGLAVPHLLRLLRGGSYSRLMPLAIPTGAALLVSADVIGRLIAPPGEVQAGVVVAFLGAPLLMLLVLRRRLVTV